MSEVCSVKKEQKTTPKNELVDRGGSWRVCFGVGGFVLSHVKVQLQENIQGTTLDVWRAEPLGHLQGNQDNDGISPCWLVAALPVSYFQTLYISQLLEGFPCGSVCKSRSLVKNKMAAVHNGRGRRGKISLVILVDDGHLACFVAPL